MLSSIRNGDNPLGTCHDEGSIPKLKWCFRASKIRSKPKFNSLPNKFSKNEYYDSYVVYLLV